jgi:hypothetical protein
MAKAAVNIRSLARSHSTTALDTLAGIARNGENEGARVQAAIALLDRGWGKAPVTHTGEDGEGDIRVTIRHIIQNAIAPTEPKVIENTERDTDAT